jgi:hypothetical protein
MYYIDMPIYAQIIWIIMGLLVLFPWIAIPSIAIYKFFQVMRLPKASVAGATTEMDIVNTKLGLTMADGGESVEDKKKK